MRHHAYATVRFFSKSAFLFTLTIGVDHMYFSFKIKEERQKQNMSQQELGEILHISRQSVSKWERGESYPSIELLIKLSELFDLTLDELVKGDHSLKEKIIKDGKQLAYPRWKTFFEILTVISVFLIVANISLVILGFFHVNVNALNNSFLFD
jgi:transcriptional regulator with XRE-family HTH domain